jgi:hypothetical protein
MEPKIQPGLRPITPDERDFKLGAITTLPDPKTIPDFVFTGPYLNYETQEEDDCSAFAVCKASELQENVLLDRKFQFALSKSKSGDPEEWGQDLRTALLTPVKLGSLERENRPPELENRPLSYLRYLTNWGDIKKLLNLSITHRKKSVVFIFPSQGMDYFDTILASMWKFKEEKRAVVFGTIFDVPLTSTFLKGRWTNGSGHAMLFIGKRTINGEPYLIAQNHYPGYAGENGVHYLDRERVNQSAEVFGAGMFVDYSPEEIQWLIENNLKIEDSWLKGILIAIIKALLDLKNRLLNLKQQDVGTVPSKWLLPALCWQESDVNPSAIGDKNLEHKAYGILQIRQPYMDDVYKWRKAQECLNNVPLSIDVYTKYMALYMDPKRIGKPITDEIIARSHNGGGGNGWNRPETQVYWWQVQKKMKMLEDGTAPKEIFERLKKYNLL